MIDARQKAHGMSRWLFVAALIVLMGLTWNASTASAASYAEQVGLSHRYTYSDRNCTRPVDPINVVWEEEANAAPENRVTTDSVARAIARHDWPRDEYKSAVFKAGRLTGLGDIGYQWIVRSSDGKCVRDARQMSDGSPANSRFHVRLFSTTYGGRYFVVGDAHRDQKHRGDGCDSVGIAPLKFGHVATSFDQARVKMAENWPGSRALRYWGNTQAMRQCNGEYTHSDGDVLYLGQFRSAAVIRSATTSDNVSEPTISGSPRPGSTLSVSPGSWSPTPSGFNYQWCKVDLENDSCAPYPGATGSSWTPGAGDIGQFVAVSVAPSSGSGEAELSQLVEITNGSMNPAAATEAASEVSATSARLNGWVTMRGLITQYRFEYGKTTAYGSTVPAAPDGYVGNEHVWNDIAGLSPGTVYHFRVVASNADGESVGNDMTFTTAPTPPIVTTNPSTGVTQTSGNLNGLVNPNGQDTYYYFEYGKGADYGNAVPASPGGNLGAGNSAVAVSNTISGLEPGVTYHYRAVGVNVFGTTYGADGTFSTDGPFVEALPPGEVTQTKIAFRARLENNGAPGSWYFQYGATDSYGSKTASGTIPQNVGAEFFASASAEGLEVGQTVHYRMVAYSNWDETTTYGPDQVATTAWSNEPSTGPAASLADWQEDVACPAAGSCISVGGYINSATGNRTIAAERWNGSSWTPIMPAAPEGTSYLEGVSCPSTTSCLAAGYVVAANQSVRPLIMKWNGSAWSEVSAGSGLPAGYNNRLSDISCAAANSCEAVGYSAASNGTEFRALAMHYDGSAWTVRQSANPNTSGGEPAQERNVLESVSCASATSCKAVGSHLASLGGSTASSPLIESLSGSEWKTEAAYTGNFPLGTQFWLRAVSCPSTSACHAVGYLRLPIGEVKAFTQHWTGTQWVGEEVFSDEATELYGVGCSSATSCRAVGKDGLGLHWNGGSWYLQAPKPPSDVDSSRLLQLSGVACPTARECHAVGYYTTKAGTTQRLNQGWSGAGAVPAATWSNATTITETSALLRGLVNPGGVDSNYYFEYGPTVSYGSKTSEAPAGSYPGGPNPNAWGLVNSTASGLQPGKTYHYRVAITNGTATAYGADATFTTKSALAEMPVTEAFNGGTSNISDFATKWAPLQWTGSTRKGKNNANGYSPVDTAANGAYFMPTVSDGGPGIANQATLATGPGVGGRVSLWLDLTNPGAQKSGYELSLQETAANIYTLTLRWRVGTSEKVLASQTGYPLPTGSQIALVDKGSELSAWTNTGSGYSKVLSGSDTLFSGGSAGIEIQGQTSTRLTNFKVGPMAEKVASFEAALKPVALLDDFGRAESQLSLNGAWAALPWSPAVVKAGKVDATIGWTPAEPSAIAGAYWQKAMASDTGTGDVVQVTSKANFNGSPSSYFSVWLNAPNPASARSGYQLRLHGGNYFALDAKLYKWVNSVPTLLGSATINCQNGTAGVKLALADRGGTVSVWSAQPGGTFSQAFSASDATYSYGYAGIEGLGTSGVKDFKLGQLSPF